MPAASASTRVARFFPEIEGLRGWLALVVLFGHVGGVLLPADKHPFNWYWGSMEVFFCISGFLIGRNFFSRYGASLSSTYFARRSLRIWPAYFVAWAFCDLTSRAISTGLLHGEWGSLDQGSGFGQFAPALFVQNIERHVGGAFNYLDLFGHSWSVALEEQFYLLGPLALLVLSRRTIPFVLVIICTLITISTLARYYGIHTHALLARLDAFALGMLVAVLEARARTDGLAAFLHRPVTYRLAALVGSALMLPFLATNYGVGYSLSQSAILNRTLLSPFFAFALFASGLVGLVATNQCGRILRTALAWKPMQALGKISYSTYLLHMPIVVVLVPHALHAVGAPYLWLVLVGPAASIAAGYLSYRLVEKPFMRFGASLKVASECPGTLRAHSNVV